MRKIILGFCLALFATAASAQAQFPAAPVTQSPTRFDAAVGVAPTVNTTAGSGACASAIAAACTATITVPGGLYAYITGVYIDVCGNATGTAATNANFTSTGLGTNPSWSYSTTAAAIVGTCLRLGDSFASPLKSNAPGTNVTVVSPAAQTNNGYTIRVYYYLAP